MNWSSMSVYIIDSCVFKMFYCALDWLGESTDENKNDSKVSWVGM